tara:strand:+ start:141 stop:440 length:300 start_codon:yes stop_codon:yes gene_type:complete
MWYSIYATDFKNSLVERLANRTQHLKRLKLLQDEGRLLLAGPLPIIDSIDPGPNGFSGSLIVAEFNSLIDAKKWANNDPFIKCGVYEKIEVKPFIKSLP